MIPARMTTTSQRRGRMPGRSFRFAALGGTVAFLRYKGAVSIRTNFDETYYDRFYGTQRDRRSYLRDESRLGDFVCAYLKYLGQPVERVIDIGCGFGQWREIVRRHFPKAAYTGVELSRYLCRRFGWKHGSVADVRPRGAFDLVICKDTLQYLAPAEIERAIPNLARLCRGVLYASALTREDWASVCDRERTDASVYLRSAQWYRRRLGREFTNLGGGLFLSPRSPALVWELEKLVSGAR